MRLQATGQLDAEFGNGGRTWIDLQSDAGGGALVHDIAVAADGSVIAAGGDVYQRSSLCRSLARRRWR